MNNANFEGRLVRDVSLRTTSSGTPAAFYVLAVQTVHGDNQSETDFIPITTYGRQAEYDAKYLRKGRTVRVEARVRSWYDADMKQGGFHFIASCVTYLGRCQEAKSAAGTAGDDSNAQAKADWSELDAQLDADFERLTADIERRLQHQVQPQQPTPNEQES